MTIQELINKAMLHIGAVKSGSDATPTESADMLSALNSMMAMWAKEDKDLQFPPQDTLTDTYPLPMWTEEPVIYNLSIRGATLFDLPIPADVAMMASNGQSFIAKTLINAKLESKDMTHMPGGESRSILTDR